MVVNFCVCLLIKKICMHIFLYTIPIKELAECLTDINAQPIYGSCLGQTALRKDFLIFPRERYFLLFPLDTCQI